MFTTDGECRIDSRIYTIDEESQKYNGYNEPLISFVEKLYHKCRQAYEQLDEKILLYKILYITTSILEVVYYFNISTTDQFKNNQWIHYYINEVRRKCKPPTLQNDIDKVCKQNGKGEAYHVRTTNKYGPEEHPYIKDVSTILCEILLKSTKGPALEMLTEYIKERNNDRNGIDMLNRLIEVFGTSPIQVAMIPYLFDWTKFSLDKSWSEYKKCLNTENFFEIHPTLTSTAIAYAKLGFEKHEAGIRLLDYLRIALGEGSEYKWTEFEAHVNKYLGNVYRRNFERAMLENKASNKLLGIDASWKDETVMDICNIKNYRDKPDQFPGVEFLKKAIKIIKKEKKSSTKKTSKGKKIPPVCGWCGRNHPSYACLRKNVKKWENHYCTNCGGKGHPKTVCTSQQTEKKNKDEEKKNDNIFLLTAPEGIYKIDMSNFQFGKMDKWYMLDSGAAISVAPHGEFKNVKLDKGNRHMYNLQSATGKQLRIYGTKQVPFNFGSEKINITIIICDVTLTLLSTNDMMDNGISVYLDKYNPYLQVRNKKYHLKYENKHFWMKQSYSSKGILGVTETQTCTQTEILDYNKTSIHTEEKQTSESKNRETLKVGNKNHYKIHSEQCGNNCEFCRNNTNTVQAESESRTNPGKDAISIGQNSTINNIGEKGEGIPKSNTQKTKDDQPGSSNDVRTRDKNNVILVPKKLDFDPGWDTIIDDYDDSVNDVTNNQRKPDSIVRIKPIPKLPSEQEILKHNVTHIPHATWCKHCVEGRMRKDHSLSVPKEERLNRTGIIIQLDYFEFHEIRILAMAETTSGYLYARPVKGKEYIGQSDEKVTMVEDFLKELGKKDVTLQCDGESTLMYLVQGVSDRITTEEGSSFNIRARFTAPYSSNSNGTVERAIRLIRDQIRVVVGYLSHKYHEIFNPNSKIVPWLIRHVIYILNRLVAQKSLNNKTRYEVCFGRLYAKNNLYEFLSSVVMVPKNRKTNFKMKMYTQQTLGLYLGRYEKNDQHIILNENGIIEYAHTVRPIHMEIDDQRIILQKFEEAPQPNAQGQEIYDDMCINSEFDPLKLVATRTVGSKTRFRELPKATQAEKMKRFGPANRSDLKYLDSKFTTANAYKSGTGGLTSLGEHERALEGNENDLKQGFEKNKERSEYVSTREEFKNKMTTDELERKINNRSRDKNETSKSKDVTMKNNDTSKNRDVKMKDINETSKSKDVTMKNNDTSKNRDVKMKDINDMSKNKDVTMENINEKNKDVKMKDVIMKDVSTKNNDIKMEGKMKMNDSSDKKLKDDTIMKSKDVTIDDSNGTSKQKKKKKCQEPNEDKNRNEGKNEVEQSNKEENKRGAENLNKVKTMTMKPKREKQNKVQRKQIMKTQEKQNMNDNKKIDEQIEPKIVELSDLEDDVPFSSLLAKESENGKDERIMMEKDVEDDIPLNMFTEQKEIESDPEDDIPFDVLLKKNDKEKIVRDSEPQITTNLEPKKDPLQSRPKTDISRFTMEQKLDARERIKRPMSPTFKAELDNDPLMGYEVDEDGRMWNPCQDEIIDGYNVNKKELEDDLRERGGLPTIGGKREWLKHKRRLEPEIVIIEQDGKRRKAEKSDTNDEDSKKTRIAGITKILTDCTKKKHDADLNAYETTMLNGWRYINALLTIEECKPRSSTNKRFEAINMILDWTKIPKLELNLFSNINNNNILAVTVSKRHVDQSKFPEKWEEARQKERNSLKEHAVYEVVDMQDIPNEHPDPIGCRWLYTLKDYPFDTYQPNNPDAEKNARYKARLIVQGMNEKIDDTYSPTPSAESVRTCLTLSIIGNWTIKFSDVQTAFLHAEVIGNPYVYPPETEKLTNTTKVWKLKKAQYGLKSAPKAWYQHISSLLIDSGWARSTLDECVFYKSKSGNEKNDLQTRIDNDSNYMNTEDPVATKTSNFPITGMIVVYVDDLIVTGNKTVVNNFFEEFAKSCHFSDPEELKINGKAITFLGFQYRRKQDYIEIDPSEYTDKILEAFDHKDARPLKTTGEPGNFILDMKDRNQKVLPKDGKEHKKYRRLVGQTLWLSSVRRDIAYSVKELSKYVHDPTDEDVARGNHLLRYLAGTRDEKVHLRPNKKDIFVLEAYTDADLAGCRTSRKSTSGGCISLNGSIIFTWAKQQDTIADSSAESEFLGMVHACKQLRYVQQFLDELKIILGDVPILHIDNTSAIEMLQSNVKSRVKHLDRKKYWVREYVSYKNVTVKYVDTKDNLADIFTKYVPNTVLETLRPAVMGREDPPRTIRKDKGDIKDDNKTEK